MSQPWWNSESDAERQADEAFDRLLRLILWAIVIVPTILYAVYH